MNTCFHTPHDENRYVLALKPERLYTHSLRTSDSPASAATLLIPVHFLFLSPRRYVL